MKNVSENGLMRKEGQWADVPDENRRQKKRRSVGEMIFDMFISGYFSYIYLDY